MRATAGNIREWDIGGLQKGDKFILGNTATVYLPGGNN